MINNIKIYWDNTILVLLVLIVPIISIFYLGNYDSYTRCGKVIDKQLPTDIHHSKHSSRVGVDTYFVVQYNDGYIEELNVDANTWYKNNIGDKVCFEKQKDNWKSMLSVFGLALSFFIGIIILVGAAIDDFHLYKRINNNKPKYYGN